MLTWRTVLKMYLFEYVSKAFHVQGSGVLLKILNVSYYFASIMGSKLLRSSLLPGVGAIGMCIYGYSLV